MGFVLPLMEEKAMPTEPISKEFKASDPYWRAISAYASQGHQQVYGWLMTDAIMLTHMLNMLQIQNDVKGHVAEIGLCQGRYFIFLSLMRRSNEKALGIDLFEIDPPSKEAFYKNIDQYFGQDPRMILWNKNSLDVKSTDIQKDFPEGIRLFSIDGGHYDTAVFNDFTVACDVLCDGGVIMVDDFFQPGFPGISEAVYRYYHLGGAQKDRVVPFAFTGNKLFFTTKNFVELYQTSIRGDRPAYRVDNHVLGNYIEMISWGQS